MTTPISRCQPIVGCAALAAIAALLLDGHGLGLHFLQKAAGYTTGGGSVQFSGAQSFLDNLRAGIAPLAIPAGTIGLTVGGIGLLAGAQWSKVMLTGVLVGCAIVFLGPQILQ
jgi:hypothetical protein